jgi:hypothetical protein
MSRADQDIVTDTQAASRSSAVRATGVRNARRLNGRAEVENLPLRPAAGQPGHGATASLRRQPARIVLGRMEGGFTGAFELVCCDCGDRPYWDYSELSFQLQRIRGPYPLAEGIAAYEQHLGLATRCTTV